MSQADSSKLLEFLQFVGRLKHIKRTGWILRDVQNPECIAGHMYRMGILSFLVDENDGLDKNKCIKMALVHDLAECIVGDLTPLCGVSETEKHQKEDKAMRELAHLAGPAGEEMYALYREYEKRQTPEAKFVKELDQFDMLLQAYEYEKSDKRPHGLQEFFDNIKCPFSNEKLKALFNELCEQRSSYELKMHQQ